MTSIHLDEDCVWFLLLVVVYLVEIIANWGKGK